VDDSIANVNACSQLGMIGIQYTDALELELKFKEIGICCDPIEKE
jgi:glucosamine 6-phosphate synthetase-like amidotransferase/phosphosugar isomerase protein